MKFNFLILNENGEEITINTLQDLPIITTGLLEVNLIKILKQNEDSKTNHNQEFEVGFIYLYFLKRCFENGALSQEIILEMSELFNTFSKIGYLRNIESEHYHKVFNQKQLKEKLGCISKVKVFYKKLSNEDKQTIFSLWSLFKDRINDELTEDINTPPPIYFLNQEFLDSNFKHLAEINLTLHKDEEYKPRNSSREIRNFYRSALTGCLTHFLSKSYVQSGTGFTSYENEIQKHLKK